MKKDKASSRQRVASLLGWMGVGCAAVVFCLGGFQQGTAETPTGYKLSKLKEAAPKSAAKNVRELLAPSGLRVSDSKDKPFIDVWLRKSVQTQNDPGQLGVDYGMLPEGTILGLLRFHDAGGGDFRDNKIPAGVYLFRSAIQPEDGDHQGVSDSRDFALVCPAEGEISVGPMSTDEAVKESVKVSGIEHPSVLFLKKFFDEAKDLPRLVKEDGGFWILDCQVPDAKKGADPVRLGIVLVGHADE